MDEIEKNHLKTLIKARNYLLSQTPTDMVAVAHITERILSCTEQHLAAADAPKSLQASTEKDKLLQRAIKALDKQVEKKASASRILSDADKIRHLIGPLGEIGRWPPK
jgi:hypothetical protein